MGITETSGTRIKPCYKFCFISYLPNHVSYSDYVTSVTSVGQELLIYDDI